MIDSTKQAITNAYNWLNENGRPSLEELIELANQGTPESMEILNELAERYDISNSGVEPRELAEKIYWASNEDLSSSDGGM